MKRTIAITATCAAIVILSLAVSQTPSVKAAGIENAAGMEYCVTISGGSSNDTVFTNNCSQDVNLTVAGQKGTWAPGFRTLLTTERTKTNGPNTVPTSTSASSRVSETQLSFL